jgi:hypothetical protein
MKLRAAMSFVVVAAGVWGCVPLRQHELLAGRADVTFSLADAGYLEALQIGSGSVPNHNRILTEESFIEAPTGERYSIRVKEHEFDVEQKFTYVRVDVYPYRGDGTPMGHWSDGIWSVHLVVDTDASRSVIEQRWKFWTFHYNPIIHGAPN